MEKVRNALRPASVLEQAKNRAKIAKLEMQAKSAETITDTIAGFNGSKVENSGYSHSGAAHRRTWAKKWDYDSGSAKQDIEKNRKTLRERTRDLHMNSPLGAAAINTTRTNCVGCGLIPNPKIDYEFLGITKEQARDLEKLIKKEFLLWSESTLCDNNDQNNFYELQQIVFKDWLCNGEEFILIRYDEEAPMYPYRLRLKLVEADRICTPGNYGGEYFGVDQRLKNENIIMNGVELDKNGKVVAYHVASFYPDEWNLSTKKKWTRIKKRGKQTGNLNILHVFNGERADQYRGVPFLAPVIESLKQLTRYTEAEIMAAVINAMFTVFITTETGNDVSGFGGVEEEEESGQELEKDAEMELGSGIINELKVGEKVQTVESTHPSGNFDSFSSAFCTYVGAALEISPEVLLKKFSNNYSASKGALNETWKAFKMRRQWFINDFCQPVYELWLNEAVSKGRILAPGYFNNPLIRQAYLNAKWNGPAQGSLDPKKDVEAAILKVKDGFSTHEDECASMNGSSFEDNIRTLKSENVMLHEANIGCESSSGKTVDQEQKEED